MGSGLSNLLIFPVILNRDLENCPRGLGGLPAAGTVPVAGLPPAGKSKLQVCIYNYT
jgi:hypothetical protein